MACKFQTAIPKSPAFRCDRLRAKLDPFRPAGAVKPWTVSVDPGICEQCQHAGDHDALVPVEEGRGLWEIFREILRGTITGGSIPVFEITRPADYAKIWTWYWKHPKHGDTKERLTRDAVWTQASKTAAMGGETSAECETRLRAFFEPRGMDQAVTDAITEIGNQGGGGARTSI